MSPATWESLERGKSLARAFRGPMASAYMKSVRLDRREDAMYWLAVMHRGRAGTNYLRRRIFGSAGEDNSDIWITEACEQLILDEQDQLDPMLYAGAYLLSLGTKWYELEDAREYNVLRARAGMARHPDLTAIRTDEALWDRYRLAIRGGNVEAAYWCVDEVFARKLKAWALYTIAADAGDEVAKRNDPLTGRLAAVIRRQHGWLAPAGKTHLLRQLIWAVARGPLASAGRQPNRDEYEFLVRRVADRLKQPLESVPSWALDGIHVSGSDPRFAGSWEGVINMVEMVKRDGRLRLDRPGVTLLEGQVVGRSR